MFDINKTYLTDRRVPVPVCSNLKSLKKFKIRLIKYGESLVLQYLIFPRQAGLQKADSDEHATGQGGQGPLHHHPLLSHQGEPQYQGIPQLGHGALLPTQFKIYV